MIQYIGSNWSASGGYVPGTYTGVSINLKKTIYILFFILTFLVSCDSYEFKKNENLKSERHTELLYESTDSIVEKWVKMDSMFLSEFRETINNDTKNIIDILGVNSHEKENLGFGYNYVQASMGKGYASIWYTIIFKDNEVVSYEFKPDLPNHKSLMKRYLKFYENIFEIDSQRIHNRYYNIEQMEQPLQISDNSPVMNENLLFLMTPFSGIEYGYSGGYAGSIFTNRGLNFSEKGVISTEICRTLLYSKNPATRLMAIEHYEKNKNDFKDTKLIDNWIETVYSELPTIRTMEGCMGIKRNSRELVEEYAEGKH
jgi:hypothetical protein